MTEDRWQERAACRNMDTDLFFPGRGESVEEARAVCAGCDVQEECLAWALRIGARDGIWGGTTERDRRRMGSRRGLKDPAFYVELDQEARPVDPRSEYQRQRRARLRQERAS